MSEDTPEAEIFRSQARSECTPIARQAFDDLTEAGLPIQPESDEAMIIVMAMLETWTSGHRYGVAAALAEVARQGVNVTMVDGMPRVDGP